MAGLTLERLKQVVDVYPEIGSIKWKGGRQGCKSGKEAGSFDANKRRQIMIDGHCYLRYRLIWLYVYGTCPKVLDHINRIQNDDRIDNLRPATTAQNMWNAGPTKNTTTGVKGVYFIKRYQKYLAQARRHQKKISIGMYKTLDEAKAAYESFAAKHDGEFFYGNS